MSHIVIETHDGYQTIRMNWTKQVPGFQRETFEAVRYALKAADGQDDVHVTVFFGTPSCFCLGTDVATFGDPNGLSELSSSVRAFFKQLIRTRKPLIAAVDGDAVGLGMTMLLHFDAIFATPHSTFRAPFAEWGLVPEAASSIILPTALGYQRAFKIFCLGGAISASEAEAAGIVTTLCDSGQLEDVARAAAMRLANLPPRAAAATRELMREGRSRLERRADLETSTFQELLGDALTQKRLRVMGRAARMALAS